MKKFSLLIIFFLLTAAPRHSDIQSMVWEEHAVAASPLSEHWFLENIGAFEADLYLPDTPQREIVVAVIDTGVDYTHPELAPYMWINEAEQNGIPGVDDDQNGYTDDIYGINTCDGNGDPMDTSKSTYQGHGTHIAGTILKTANALDGNPYNIKIMAIKAGSDYGSFQAGDVIAALQYAVAHGADVINMSFGSDRIPVSLKAALEQAARSAILVAAAGNQGCSTSESGYSGSLDVYPAGYPFVVGVMAHDSLNRIAGFSNWDFQPNTMADYELSAPGLDIFAAFPGSSYRYMSGTSMAAAVTSGAAALLCAKYSNTTAYSPACLSGHLMNTGNSTSSYTDLYGISHSFRRLDLVSLLSAEPVPDLALTTVTVSDEVRLSPRNNGDRQLNPGETIALGITLRNKQIDAKHISLTLSAPDGSPLSQQTIDSLPALTDKVCDLFTITLPERTGSFLLNLTITYENGCRNEDTTLYTNTVPLLLEITDSTQKPPANVIPLQGITLAAPAPAMKAGTSQQLLLSFIPVNTTESPDIRFISSHPMTADVDADGRITARQKGTTVITVIVNDTFSASVTIIVTELPAPPAPSPPAPVSPNPPAAGTVKPFTLITPKISAISKKIAFPKITGFKIRKSKQKLVFSWNKSTIADGYELYYRTPKSKTYKRWKTVSKNSLTIASRSKYQNYSFKVRAYIIANGNKIYGSFSSVQKSR